jgi:predicted ATP-dependent endonuclease of OLD family
MDSISVKGFKSFKSIEEFELKRFNILVGNCGSGKSNFLSLFHLLKTVGDLYNLPANGIDNLLHCDSNSLEIKILEGEVTYGVAVPFEKDFLLLHISGNVNSFVKYWRFFDNQNKELNLYDMSVDHPQEYKSLVDSVYCAFPYLHNGTTLPVDLFELKGYQFSDSLRRFIQMATILLMPGPASLIVLEGPELGLDLNAISVLAELIKTTPKETQFVVSTHSPEFMSQFSADDLVLAELKNGSSTLTRLNEEKVSQWLGHYSLGELWVKGILSNCLHTKG